MSPPRQFFPIGKQKREKKDSDSLATNTEALLGLMRAVRGNGEQIEALIKRLDGLILWVTQYVNYQQIKSNKTPSRPPAWIPTSKKEITGVVALVVFALTVLAIILASCGVMGCEEIPK